MLDPSTKAVDALVGRNIKDRRINLGMTLEILGRRAGISLEEIERYEAGKDRVSASRLFSISNALDIDIRAFFKGAEGLQEADGPHEFSRPHGSEPYDPRLILTLIESFQSLPLAQKDALLAMVVAMAGAGEGQSETNLIRRHPVIGT